MFKLNDLVVYGSTGVCRITDICTPDFHGVDKKQVYYVMKPVFGEGVIYCPVDNCKVHMRTVISKDRAKELMETIPSVKAEIYHNRSAQMLAEHYSEAFNSHNCDDLIKLVASIREKKQALCQQKRKLGQVDERFMKRAQNLLLSELAVALGTDRENIEEHISQLCGGELKRA